MAQKSKYPVIFAINIDGNDGSNITKTEIDYLQEPTYSELEKAAKRQLSENKLLQYDITKLFDNDDCEIENDSEVEDIFDDIDENDAVHMKITIS